MLNWEQRYASLMDEELDENGNFHVQPGHMKPNEWRHDGYVRKYDYLNRIVDQNNAGHQHKISTWCHRVADRFSPKGDKYDRSSRAHFRNLGNMHHDKAISLEEKTKSKAIPVRPAPPIQESLF